MKFPPEALLEGKSSPSKEWYFEGSRRSGEFEKSSSLSIFVADILSTSSSFLKRARDDPVTAQLFSLGHHGASDGASFSSTRKLWLEYFGS